MFSVYLHVKSDELRPLTSCDCDVNSWVSPCSSPLCDPVTVFRLVLVGRTGVGKSSSGNTILGRDAFRADISRLSGNSHKYKRGEVFKRELIIVDTPGLFDTSLSEDAVKREISKCINMSIFGEGAWRYTMILFTHGDRVKTDFEKVLKGAGPELQEVLKKAGNRYHAFNNLSANDRGQVLDLLEKVDKMVAENGGRFYSNYTYLQVEEMLKQKESELREFYQKKLEEEIKAVELKYEKKLEEAQEEKQQVKERLQSELEEMKRYYWALESGVRQVVEQTVAADSIECIAKFHETLKLN
uniref:AIG1-type G domain-containing protein n=1 Tax=Pundamilia nyererei TaxID=303518 RepID=A0A3B4G675_9CICH